MLRLDPAAGRQRLHLLCLGAHSDDLEIGCGGALLRCSLSAAHTRAQIERIGDAFADLPGNPA